jgi:hypothetical protein
MADTTRRVTLTFAKDLSADDVEKLRQKTDALDARVAAAEAAHHHDVTKEF